jgi:hypothetical protein
MLVPFKDTPVSCPKCNAMEAGKKFHKANDINCTLLESNLDHLHLTCSICSFEWGQEISPNGV